MTDRLDREECQRIVKAFEKKYGDDPNFNQACMRFNQWDGHHLEVKVKDIWGETAKSYPHLFEGVNVFVEEAPAVTVPLPQD